MISPVTQQCFLSIFFNLLKKSLIIRIHQKEITLQKMFKKKKQIHSSHWLTVLINNVNYSVHLILILIDSV